MAGRSRRASLDAAIELMYFAYRGMVAKPDRVLEARNLGRAHHRVLFFVARLERPTVGELLRTLAVSKQSLNGPLRDLKAQDLIAWERDEGDARVRRMNAQATRYRAGHFLKLHDDFNAEEGRLYAYVINLTREWKADWGGLLQFLDAEGRVIDTLMPRWNSLSIFRVPAPHVVSLVAPWAEGERLAVTGWMLT